LIWREHAIHLGVNIYYWGSKQQSRLLTRCLGPVAQDLWRERLVDRFWFDRFDARGPHVFALFRARGVPEEVRSRLAEPLAAYLAASPSSEPLSREEAAARSTACRGKAQGAPDRLPGLADNNSCCFFEHPPGGYPYSLSAGLANEDELWEILTEQCFQVIAEIAEAPDSSPGAALCWLAELDRELREAGGSPEKIWRFHATTLLMSLEARLAVDPAGVEASLPLLIGTRNLEAFSEAWEEAGSSGNWPGLPRLVRILAAEGSPVPRHRALLREIAHTTLKQLGVTVAQQIPLILFAWHRDLANRAPARDPRPG